MKIAVPSTGESATSLISDKLGRAPFLIFYNSLTGEYEAIKNPGFQIQDGSGLQTAELLIAEKTEVLLTKEIGRKAYSALMHQHINVRLLELTGNLNLQY